MADPLSEISTAKSTTPTTAELVRPTPKVATTKATRNVQVQVPSPPPTMAVARTPTPTPVDEPPLTQSSRKRQRDGDDLDEVAPAKVVKTSRAPLPPFERRCASVPPSFKFWPSVERKGLGNAEPPAWRRPKARRQSVSAPPEFSVLGSQYDPAYKVNFWFIVAPYTKRIFRVNQTTTLKGRRDFSIEVTPEGVLFDKSMQGHRSKRRRPAETIMPDNYNAKRPWMPYWPRGAILLSEEEHEEQVAHQAFIKEQRRKHASRKMTMPYASFFHERTMALSLGGPVDEGDAHVLGYPWPPPTGKAAWEVIVAKYGAAYANPELLKEDEGAVYQPVLPMKSNVGPLPMPEMIRPDMWEKGK
ncbi:hypothetical protein CYLTODRAFT_425853 [Cylindrobasidium torrendii FP15055 ss-10]|uniref:Uncharacterized protein n=1 Tax=Cylindrobasidium torrendii FP15055 ss-10 TaxID=1314674 RepID=A0A0D7AZS1_9AGAR|nr:hypothetical protein CYLTODRAFT_425853 [Cylindrobasidium torrendii FP15055 ss-10]